MKMVIPNNILRDRTSIVEVRRPGFQENNNANSMRMPVTSRPKLVTALEIHHSILLLADRNHVPQGRLCCASPRHQHKQRRTLLISFHI